MSQNCGHLLEQNNYEKNFTRISVQCNKRTKVDGDVHFSGPY